MKLPSTWQTQTLDELVSFRSGGTPSKNNSQYWGGEFPWVTPKDLKKIILFDSQDRLTKEGAATAQVTGKDSLLILVRGMTLFKEVPVCLVGRNMAFNQDIKALAVRDDVDPRYLQAYLISMKNLLLRCVDSAGHGTGRMNMDMLRGFLVLFPPLPEQKAIVDLLSAWDEAIEKTERLIQAKENSLKAKIQRMMGKEAIDANGWPIVHLGKLFSEVTRKVGRKELTPFSISAGIGFVSQCEKWGKDISGAQYKNYTHLKAGEFSYNKGNSKRYQQGCVYLLKEGEICVPNVFISFKARANKDVVPEFFEHYFIADYHARELKRYITSGARSDGLLNLDKKDFFKIMVPCPSPGEQKNIAESLNASQHEIDLLKQLAEKYKTQKCGLMQKILTGQWRIRPEIVERYKEA